MKIFGIGLSKTGTTSLTNAMKLLDFTAGHFVSDRQLEMLYRYSFICDLPIPARYKEYDKEYSESKFIYTVREKESWLTSCEKHWIKYPEHLMPDWRKARRVEQYGIAHFDRDVFSAVYDKHNQDVFEYFADRQDLLVLDITEGWEPLCKFLGRPVVKNLKFPHLNKTE